MRFNQRKQEQKHRQAIHSAEVSNFIAHNKNNSQQPIITDVLKQKIENQITQICAFQECAFQTKDLLTFKNHKITHHGDHDTKKLAFILFKNGHIISKVEYKLIEDSGLINQFKLNEDSQIFMDDKLYNENTTFLLTHYNNSILAYLAFENIESEFHRICIIKNVWNSKKYNLELWILIQKLSDLVSCQRITEIFLQIPQDAITQYSALRFFKVKNFVEIIELLKIQNQDEHRILVSRKTNCCISSCIPTIKTPQNYYISEKAKALLDFIKLLKQNGILSALNECLKIQSNYQSVQSEQQAQISDQAITTDLVFQKIYNRLLVSKENFFDPCAFAPNWNAETHYNALFNPFHGKFVFLNPPYSLVGRFVTKALIEFLNGKSIVMVIPQFRKNTYAIPRLIKYLGDVHKEGLIRFNPYSDVVQTSIQIIYLIQPEHLSFLEEYHRFKNKKQGPCSYIDIKHLQVCEKRRIEKREVAERLMKQECPIRQIRSLSGLAYRDLYIIQRQLQKKQLIKYISQQPEKKKNQ